MTEDKTITAEAFLKGLSDGSDPASRSYAVASGSDGGSDGESDRRLKRDAGAVGSAKHNRPQPRR